jgi:type VI secretion system protein ImpA
MSSDSILDFETLLVPIGGSNPAGEPVPFPVRKKLDDLRKEIRPDAFAADDPRRPKDAQPADWPGIEKLTQDILTQTSKDLLVAARLTEALVKQHGFGGLRDGLRLMRRLAQECWNRVYPAIPVLPNGEPEAQAADPEAQAAAEEAYAAALETRAAAFDWLDDELKGAKFPYTLRTVPLTKAKDERNITWQDWRDAQDDPASLPPEVFDRAVAATPRKHCQTVVDDIAESAKELDLLGTVLNQQMGQAAPGLAQMRKALLECQELAQQILQRKPPEPVPPPDGDAGAAESATEEQPGAASAARRPLTREDVLARLAEASAQLLQMEPHSPIAYLVQRAVKLARLPLPELMRVLVRDPNVLGQLDRDLDLGLEQPGADKQETKGRSR